MMMWRPTLLIAIISFLLCSGRSNVAAQPTLPNMSCTAEKGIVLLTWACQYNGVKAIAVMRSADSVYNYKIIGYVKKLDKGVQAFVDGHPAAGKNYYKLNIVFSSGLNWGSNHRGVYIDKATLDSMNVRLPDNDSLQRFVVAVADSGTKSNAQNSSGGSSGMAQGSAPSSRKISLSFEADTVVAGRMTGDTAVTAKPVVVHRKILLLFDEVDTNEPLLLPSKYVSRDAASGHVRVELPDDVAQYHYAITFFDEQDHKVVEVPRLNAPKVLLDKRNFQRKGLYRFVISKDGLQLESGYVQVTF